MNLRKERQVTPKGYPPEEGLAMYRATLCMFLLLWPQGAAFTRAEGEMCGDWISQEDSPLAAFSCLQLRDGADTKFCCGTCDAPYCCTDRDARLNQQQCPHVAPRKASIVDAPTTTQPSTSTPLQRPLRWGPELVFLILIPVSVLLWVMVRCWRKYRFWPFWAPVNAAERPAAPREFSAAVFYRQMEDPPPRVVEVREDNGDLQQWLLTFLSQRGNAGNPAGPAEDRNVAGLALQLVSLVDMPRGGAVKTQV